MTKISYLAKITVAILVGGLGTRLQSKVKRTPKVLATVAKHPFLEYLLNQLNQAGFKNIVLCTGYLSEQVEKTFGKKYKNLNLIYSVEQIPLGTGGGLRKALLYLNSEDILVMNGDSYCALDFKKFWEFHLQKASQASLALTTVPDSGRYGAVRLSTDGSIVKFEEKNAVAAAGFINAGIYLIHKSLIAEIPENKQISIEQDIFPTWIGRKFYGYKGSNDFIDIGTPESYNQAQEFFAKFK